MNWGNPVFIGYCVLAGVATAALARRRGRAVAPWFIFGAVAWFIAIPWLYLTKSQLREGQTASAGMTALAVVAICGALVLARINFNSIKDGLPPNCDTYLGVSAVQDFVATSPVGKASGLQLKTLTDIKEVNRSTSELACTGIAHMNTAAAVPMDYRFLIKDGKRSVEAQW
jgi:apolipoprotein N-acyltransferase